jgi:hypothetical protein
MTRACHRRLLILSSLLLAASAGCSSQPLFQVETVIRADGSCDRTFWQPRDEMFPAEASQAAWKARWRHFGPAGVPPAFVAERPTDDERKYVTASGHFRSPAEIPEHFRNVVELGPAKEVGRLARSYEHRDYAFVIEHRWREALTNIVTPERFLKARDRLLDRGVPFLEEGITRVYGARHDVRGLIQYIREDGRRFLEQAALVWYEHAARHRPAEEFGTRLAELAQVFGLDLLDDAGKLLEVDRAQERIGAFVRHRMMLGVRRRDGGRLTDSELRKMTDSSVGSPVRQAWNTYWQERQRDMESALAAPLLETFGLYNHPLGISGAGNPKFAFTLTLPGKIVATNGAVEAADRTSWRFSGDESFPSGYVMEARSVEIDRDVERRILGRAPIADRDQAVAFTAELERSEKLAEILRTVRATGQRRWLDEYAPAGQEERDRLARLRQILGDRR